MKYQLRTATLLIAGTIAALSASLDKADRKALVKHLDQSSAQFLESVEGLTPEQWNYKPAPDKWSIGECAEHIVITEGFLREMIERQVLTSPAVSRPPDQKALDQKVLAMITDRSHKAKAPEPVAPKRQFATPAEAIARFKEARKKTLSLAETNDDLRAHTMASPFREDLDAYQWMLYLSGHTMRHTAQIQEVKASSGFPKAK